MEIERKRYYHQNKVVSWLKTPAGTIWIDFAAPVDGNYIQPEDERLRETPFGLYIDMMDPDEFDELFDMEERTTVKI